MGKSWRRRSPPLFTGRDSRLQVNADILPGDLGPITTKGTKMKSQIIYSIILASLTLAASAADEYYLVKEGQPQARIYLPRVCGKATLLAANELSETLEKVSGARVPVDLYGSGDPRYAVRDEAKILLDPTIDPTREISADGTEDQFTITRSRDTLTIAGNSDTAVLYGVYQLLHEIGVRWFTPGDLGENVPHMTSIPIGSGTKHYKPSFRKRELDYSGYNRWHFDPNQQAKQHYDYDLWLLRNRLHFARSIHWNSLHRFDFDWTREHTYHNVAAVLRTVGFEKEPERFPLVTRDGETKRRPLKERVQICFTNPKNIQGTIDLALKWFEENPDKLTYPASLQDCGGVCECPACTKANGGINPARDPNRLVWTFMNQVIKGIRAKMPNKRIAFYACYGGMTEPPEDIKAEPGLVAVTCHVQSNRVPITDPDDPFNKVYYHHILRIKATGAEMECYEYTMFAGTPQPLAILSTAKTYANLGYVGYHTESMGRDAQREMIAWVQSQLAWDTSQDPDELLNTFCREYYGAAGDDVLAVLHMVDDSVRRLPKVILGSLGVTQSIMTGEVNAAGRARLAQAVGKVSGPEKERLVRFDRTFEMWAREGEYARAVYGAMMERTPTAREQAANAIAAFTDYWDKNDLNNICSPSIRAQATGMTNIVARIEPTITPTRSKDLASADRDAIMHELFSLDTVPDDMGNLFLLPEVWRFSLDLHREAVANGWTEPGFDDSAWHKLSTYNIFEQQGFNRYDGAFCYRVRFKAPDFPKDRKIFLRIGALDDEGSIYVNGKLIHTRWHLHPDDWMSSFAIDVTDTLKPDRENVIAVVGNDEYGAGGIWKPCGLYTLP